MNHSYQNPASIDRNSKTIITFICQSTAEIDICWTTGGSVPSLKTKATQFVTILRRFHRNRTALTRVSVSCNQTGTFTVQKKLTTSHFTVSMYL